MQTIRVNLLTSAFTTKNDEYDLGAYTYPDQYFALPRLRSANNNCTPFGLEESSSDCV